MTDEQIREEIKQTVEYIVMQEKKKLAHIIHEELIYTGEFAKSSKIMDAVKKWSTSEI